MLDATSLSELDLHSASQNLLSFAKAVQMFDNDKRFHKAACFICSLSLQTCEETIQLKPKQWKISIYFEIVFLKNESEEASLNE